MSLISTFHNYVCVLNEENNSLKLVKVKAPRMVLIWTFHTYACVVSRENNSLKLYYIE